MCPCGFLAGRGLLRRRIAIVYPFPMAQIGNLTIWAILRCRAAEPFLSYLRFGACLNVSQAEL